MLALKQIIKHWRLLSSSNEMELYMKIYTFAKGHTQQTEHSIPLRNINSVKESLSGLWTNLVNWRAREKSGWDHGEDEKKAGKLENEKNLSRFVYKKLHHFTLCLAFWSIVMRTYISRVIKLFNFFTVGLEPGLYMSGLWYCPLPAISDKPRDKAQSFHTHKLKRQIVFFIWYKGHHPKNNLFTASYFHCFTVEDL
jgi:hypothetical protein